jgi:hypothetical protein
MSVKNYLNKDERSHVSIGFIADEAYMKLLNGNISKEERKCLQKTHEWWEKYAKALFLRVGNGEAQKIVNEFTGGRIEVKRNVQATQLHDIVLDAGDVHDLAGPIIESHCRDCKKTGVDAAECSISKIFIKALVPNAVDLIVHPSKKIIGWNEYGKSYQKVMDAYDGVCPYRL